MYAIKSIVVFYYIYNITYKKLILFFQKYSITHSVTTSVVLFFVTSEINGLKSRLSAAHPFGTRVSYSPIITSSMICSLRNERKKFSMGLVLSENTERKYRRIPYGNKKINSEQLTTRTAAVLRPLVIICKCPVIFRNKCCTARGTGRNISVYIICIWYV